MESVECSYEGCHNNRKHLKTGLCAPHRKVQLQEGQLRPLRPRQRIQSPVCTGPECSRPSESHDLCKEHDRQRRTGKPLWVIGTGHRLSQLRRWEQMSDADKAAWNDRIRAGLPAERTLSHSRNLSASLRAHQRAKRVGTERPCRTCGTSFVIDEPGRWYCSKTCQRLYGQVRRHGLTVEEFRSLLKAQGNHCAVCGGPWRGWNGRTAHIDHDHVTGQVRGLLCSPCNTAIGRFGDDPQLLRRAAAYLERSKEQTI